MRSKPLPHGTTTLEVIVAGTLLLATLGSLFTLVPHLGKLWRSSRDYHIAINELANQLEAITILPESDQDKALEKLEVSSDARDVLHSPELSHQLIDDESGKRIVLSIQWQREPDAKPVSMTAWISSPPVISETATGEIDGENQP